MGHCSGLITVTVGNRVAGGDVLVVFLAEASRLASHTDVPVPPVGTRAGPRREKLACTEGSKSQANLLV